MNKYSLLQRLIAAKSGSGETIIKQDYGNGEGKQDGRYDSGWVEE